MTPRTGGPPEVRDAVAALREELNRLSTRIAALEAAVAAPSRDGQQPQHAEEISEEVLAVISAAIAAYLGKKPHIRQVRLLGAAAWAQQGRVTIQASHALAGRPTRGAS
jgi:methylmalonyl-CoA carboxyltransferase large subunit